MERIKAKDLGTLIREWERVDGSRTVEILAARTAAALSCVEDVSKPILEALDRLISYEDTERGTAIFEVVRYLRGLDQFQRMLFTEEPSAASKKH
ncbi:MAG: hypothetical protein WAO58_02690 [Fimbriimonadaceae bacterium]